MPEINLFEVVVCIIAGFYYLYSRSLTKENRQLKEEHTALSKQNVKLLSQIHAQRVSTRNTTKKQLVGGITKDQLH